MCLNSLVVIALIVGLDGISLLLMGNTTTRGVPAGTTSSKFAVCQIAGKLISLGYISVSTNPDRQVKWLSKLLTNGNTIVE